MSRTKKIIGMGLGLAVLISSMSLAFAVTGQSKSTSDTAKPKYQRVEQFKGKGGEQRVNPLSNLVTAGTITAAQQKAIEDSMRPTKALQRTMKESLDSLVKAGTITQVQEDTVIKADAATKVLMQAEQEKKLVEMAKEKGITVAELKAQMEEHKGDRGQGPFGDFKGKGKLGRTEK
ncbi:MAG TPA: hypothetical protein VIK78_18935 [Ruminiclostridium sp.]